MALPGSFHDSQDETADFCPHRLTDDSLPSVQQPLLRSQRHRNLGELAMTVLNALKPKVLRGSASGSEEPADDRQEPKKTRFLPKLNPINDPNFWESDVAEDQTVSIVSVFFWKVNLMRLAVCVATLTVMFLSDVASAGENAVHLLPASTSTSSAPIVKVSQSRSIFQPVRRTQKSFFGRIMDLERRKNAWLRRTFLN